MFIENQKQTVFLTPLGVKCWTIDRFKKCQKARAYPKFAPSKKKIVDNLGLKL